MSERDLIERLRNLGDRDLSDEIDIIDWLTQESERLFIKPNEEEAWLSSQLLRAATTIVRLSEALAEAEKKEAEAERAMRDVITQADCLRHYARIEDNRQYKILETVGEIQAGHFEDIAVRLFPSLQTYLDQKRAERAPPRDLSQGGQHG